MKTEQKTETFSGKLEPVNTVNTRSGMPMVTFELAGNRFKAFADVARMLQASENREVEVTAKKGSYKGETEFAVVSVQVGNGENVTDTRNVSVETAASKGPVGKGMIRWHARPGERAQFRSEIVKCGNAQMLEIFDRLPHPVCKEEEWAELMEEMRKHEKAHAEELRNYARSLGYSEKEIADYSANRADALGWTATKSSVIAGLDSRRKTYGQRNAHEAEFQREPVAVAASSSGAERPPCSTERKASAQLASAPAPQPQPARTETLTDDFTEVPAGSMNFEQMEAEYGASQERRRLEQTAKSPAVTA